MAETYSDPRRANFKHTLRLGYSFALNQWVIVSTDPSTPAEYFANASDGMCRLGQRAAADLIIIASANTDE